MPGGHAPSAGNMGEPKDLYKIVASTIVAKVAPMSIGTISCGQPIMTGIPIVRNMQLADEKVAPEIEVCTKFCLCMFLKLFSHLKGI